MARRLTKSDATYWSVRARNQRQLFPNTNIIVYKNTLEKDGKVTFKAPASMGKRDIIEYLRKVYKVSPLKVNSMNYDGKIKQVMQTNGRGLKRYRTKPYKKFIVTLGRDALLPEQALFSGSDGDAIEGQVIETKT